MVAIKEAHVDHDMSSRRQVRLQSGSVSKGVKLRGLATRQCAFMLDHVIPSECRAIFDFSDYKGLIHQLYLLSLFVETRSRN
jgi:hypothetical protein